MAAVAKQDPVDVEIGARVHDYLWRNRVPQNSMAPLIGMSQQSLGRKVRGDSAWTAGELHRLARLLRVSVSWLYGETEEEPARPKGLEPLTFWSGVCEHDEAPEVHMCAWCGRRPAISWPDDLWCGICDLNEGFDRGLLDLALTA